MSLIFVWVACIAAIAGPHAQPNVSPFSKLPAGDRLEIDMRSSGCFSQDHFAYTFGRTPHPTISIIEFVTSYDGDQRHEDAQYLGTIVLSQADLSQLDQLLIYYRSPHGEGCTTVDTLMFRQMRGNTQVAQESFRDASCDLAHQKLLHPEWPAFLSWYDLRARLNKN